MKHWYAAVVALALGCESGPSEPEPRPSLDLSVSPSSVTIDQGASGGVTGTWTVGGSFAGTVSVTLVGVPAGVSGAIGAPTTSGSTTTAPVTLQVELSALPGSYPITVRASGSGVSDEETLTLTVVAVTDAEITVRPAAIDDVLYNPGMGFTDSHFAYGYAYPEGTFVSFGDYLDPPPYPDPAEYPPATVAYFRWCWAEVEPLEGQIDFERFDAIIAHAAERSEGERLGFRLLTVDDDPDCMPDWLLSRPGYVGYERGRHVPDYGNDVFLAALENLYGALGARYDGHPGMDHVDLGIVGCWGEWNQACLTDRPHLCEVMGQSDSACLETFERVLDIMIDAFPTTPKIMLGKGEGVYGDAMDHALSRGAGWRVDCFGDWGIFGPDWNHHTDAYPQVVSRVGDAWQRGPVHMEVCFTMPHMYHEYGMSVELVQETFDWALDNHISVFNGKNTQIPEPYWPIIEDFLRKAGYRLVIESATHPSSADVGQPVLIETLWRNVGVAPPYLPHRVAFRLRDSTDGVVAQTPSGADILGWLPGDHAETDTLVLPADLPPGTYAVDVAILSLDGSEPAIDLAIEGRRADGWYTLSAIDVR